MANINSNQLLSTRTLTQGPGSEIELKTCLQEQGVVFETAVTVIERLEIAASRRELGNPDAVSQLQKSLELVVNAQQRVSAAYAPFSKSNAALSADLRASLRRHEDQLKTLIGRIDHLQQTFENVRSELTPQLDLESRRRNMQAAYLKSLKTV